MQKTRGERKPRKQDNRPRGRSSRRFVSADLAHKGSNRAESRSGKSKQDRGLQRPKSQNVKFVMLRSMAIIDEQPVRWLRVLSLSMAMIVNNSDCRDASGVTGWILVSMVANTEVLLVHATSGAAYLI